MEGRAISGASLASRVMGLSNSFGDDVLAALFLGPTPSDRHDAGPFDAITHGLAATSSMDFSYLSLVQASVAVGVVGIYIVSRVLPAAPQWCNSFAQEARPHGKPKRSSVWTLCLVLIAAVGAAAAAIAVVASPLVRSRQYQLATWAAVLLLTVADRPQRTPKGLLVIYGTMLVCALVLLVPSFSLDDHITILHVGQFCAVVAGIIVILCMPMRDPELDTTGISPPHHDPSPDLRSPEDNLTLWRFMSVAWMAPLIQRGSKKTLDENDVWQLPYEFQHGRLQELFRDLKGSLLKRLLLANGLDLIITSCLGTLSTLATLGAPLLLQRLLQSIEAGSSHRQDALFYAGAILAVRLVAAQCAVFTIWFSRRAYERSRGEMITTIYAKTLTRKTIGSQSAKEAQQRKTNGAAPTETTPLLGGSVKESKLSRALTFVGLRRRPTNKEPTVQVQESATTGKILNLLRNDVYSVAQRFWDFADIIIKPLLFVLSLALVWALVGWPCFLGVAWVGIVQLTNVYVMRHWMTLEKKRRKATDVRLDVTSQFVEAIRHLRWYDWQSKWMKNILDARDQELRIRVVVQLWSFISGTLNVSAGAIFPVAAFFGYTYVAGKTLPVDVAFPAMQLFAMLEQSLRELPDLISTLLNASVSMKRLEEFMKEPDKEDGLSNEQNLDIEFQDASFAWPGHQCLVLKHMDLRFTTGLSVIVGKVGSGKTALLQAILGELDHKGGEYVIPQEMVGYCAQLPWLQHMSIRENILFSAPYDPVRYKQVLDACALTPDLATFKHGDLSDIGENGIGLSGGQKSRVALARAVYSHSRILLLDDPLASLDHHTAESIVQRLFLGPLMEGRTIILVTHRVDLCTHLATQVVEIDEGKARILGQDEIVRELAHLATQQDNKKDSDQKAHTATEEMEDAAIPDKFIEDEHRASGGVVLRTYWTYIKAGTLRWWSLLISIFVISRLVRLLNIWFIKSWGERYLEIKSVARSLEFHTASNSSDLFDFLPNPQNDVAPWLIGFLILALVSIVFFTLANLALLLITYTAAKRMFFEVVQKVSTATFRFYDTTPVGRLMNRLTSDIGMLDGGIVSPLQNVAFWAIVWISSMVVIGSTTPLFFVAALFMTVWFVMIFLRFLPTSQSLRRLEMVSLSPLMSNFGILVDGLATIRAFKAQSNFQQRNIVVTDAFQKMDHFYWSLQAWLMYRFESLSAFSTFVLTMLALYNELSPGLTAFVLASAAQFVDATHNLCRQYGVLQMDFVSVERVVELLDLEEEPSGDIEPPAYWPTYNDDITFENVTLKYAPHLEPSLVEVSFSIPGGSTCAVLGRTGSGKSTLALALLATMRPEAGSIKVGAMDLAEVDVHAWRRRVTFVAQDPVLFPGTLRQNLDPLDDHTDEECLAVLHRVLGPEWTVDARVDAGGKNLSQGQRQLVGIGRAVLRRSPVIILDEATASIDKKTAIAIQDVLRDELKQSTVITIAHRLEAVKDADYFLRLDKGRVVECGPANTNNE